ncbi:unknown [Alistipes sp. CAG:268]|nr:unknown [Alistipes sp. CAG:268]
MSLQECRFSLSLPRTKPNRPNETRTSASHRCDSRNCLRLLTPPRDRGHVHRIPERHRRRSLAALEPLRNGSGREPGHLHGHPAARRRRSPAGRPGSRRTDPLHATPAAVHRGRDDASGRQFLFRTRSRGAHRTQRRIRDRLAAHRDRLGLGNQPGSGRIHQPVEPCRRRDGHRANRTHAPGAAGPRSG